MSGPREERPIPPSGEDRSSGVNRRGFLKGAGMTVAAVSVTGTEAIGRTRGAGGVEDVEILGPEPVKFTLRINGDKQDVKASPMTTLLDLLRNDLDLTGTKRVCDRASCGACTVIVNGKSANACTLLAIDLEGKDIRTVEGLAKEDGTLAPIQSAFVECDALQCGFCTPGMLMSCTALLVDDPKPDREAVAKGLSGNICRCGTYENIFEAVQLAASGKAGVRKR